MTLQEKLKAFKDNFESGGPPFNVSKDVVETMHRATDEIRASGILDRVLKAGDRAPEFSLPNEYSETVSSGELLARGNLVVSFYRGVW
jgi:hypothetical protein